MSFQVRDGRLHRDDQPYLAVGVNYHPSLAACRIWSDWDPEPLKRDFHAMAAAGLNTVRLFLFWRDFQPRPEQPDPAVLERLGDAIALAADAGLACVVSLFTVWMNGQLLDLPWRSGRDPWRDPLMLRAEREYARAVAGRLARHDKVLGYDLGDELWNIDPTAARSLSRAEVAQWQSDLAGAIRHEHPGALVLQANDASGFFGGGPFGTDNSAALDLIGTHGFPTWAPGSIESTLSVKATHLTAFLSRVATAYGTPFVDEIGSYGVDEPTAAAYLRAAAASTLAAGASGILAWCWQDIESTAEPYDQRPAERLAGLHRADGQPKPAMVELGRIARAAADLAVRRDRGRVALYLPDRVRAQGSTYLDGTGGAVATFYAYLLLVRAHLDFDVSRDDLAGRSLVICPSMADVTLADVSRLTEAAHAGATVYCSLGDHLHGFPGEALTGAEIVDFCGPRGRQSLCWDGREWPLCWDTVATRPTTMRATSGRVLASYPDGSPALVENQIGRGRVLFSNAPFEAQLDRPDRLGERAWELFYRELAELAGIRPLVHCAHPDVELVPASRAGTPYTLVVNHSQGTVRTVLTGAGVHCELSLASKEWRIVPHHPTL